MFRNVKVMPGQTELEQRLEAVEKAVLDLQRQLAAAPVSSDWLAKVTGSVTDEEAFREVLELGRAFRLEDRPSDEDEGDDQP